MHSASEIFSEIKRRKLEFALSIRKFELQNWDKHLPNDRFNLESVPEANVYIFSGGRFRISEEKVYENADQCFELVLGLRGFIESFQPEFYQELDKIIALEAEAEKISRAENILHQIAENIDLLPDLKGDIETIGRMLERGEDIKEYCLRKKFNWNF